MKPRRGPIAIAVAMAAARRRRGPTGKRLAAAIDEAAGEVDGVVSSRVRISSDGTFRRLAHGPLHIEAADRAALLGVYDEAMRAVVTVLHDAGEDDRVVGGVVGIGTHGTEATVRDRGIDRGHRLDTVIARHFLQRYGLA